MLSFNEILNFKYIEQGKTSVAAAAVASSLPPALPNPHRVRRRRLLWRTGFRVHVTFEVDVGFFRRFAWLLHYEEVLP